MNAPKRFTNVLAGNLVSRAWMIRAAAAAALLLAAPAPVRGQAQAAGCTAPIPASRGAVNDFADVVADSTETRLTALIQQVREKSEGEILVVTLASMHGCTERGMAERIGREWRAGGEDPETRMSVLVLVVPSEQMAGITVGRGSARVVPNEELEQILHDSMFPAFQAGDIDAGISAGVLELARRFAERFGFTLHDPAPK